MLQETNDTEEIIQRVAALDIGKAELVCCARVASPDTPGKRLQEVRTYRSPDSVSHHMTRSLLVLADRLGRWRDPGDDGGHQRLLEPGVLPA